MPKTRILFFTLAILVGVFMFVYSGMDDSPGGQLLGLITFLVGVVGLIRGKKKNKVYFPRDNSTHS